MRGADTKLATTCIETLHERTESGKMPAFGFEKQGMYDKCWEPLPDVENGSGVAGEAGNNVNVGRRLSAAAMNNVNRGGMAGAPMMAPNSRKAMVDGIVIGDVVKLDKSEAESLAELLEEARADVQSGPWIDAADGESLEELTSRVTSYQYVVLSVEPGDRDGGGSTATLQRLMNDEYLKDVIDGLEKSLDRAKDNTDPQGKDGAADDPFKTMETLIDIDVNA